MFVAAERRVRARSPRASTSRSRCSRRRASPTRSSAASSGVVEAALIFGALLVILDSFFHDPGHARRTPTSCRSCARSGRAIDRDARPPTIFRDTIIPAFFAADRVPRPRLHRSRVPARLSVIDRAVLAGPDARGGPRAHRGAARPRRRDRPARRAGSSRSRPTSARDDRASHARFGETARNRSCSGRRAMPTCTLSTGCTTASTW